MEIFKFGGGTLTDVASIKHLGKIMNPYKNDTIVIVVSAFGKVTNMLEKIVQRKINHIPCDDAIKALYDYHLHILYGLFEVLDELLLQALDLCKAHLSITPTSLNTREDQEQLYSDIVSWGEILSSKIIAAYLAHSGIPCLWVDASLYIQTRCGRMNAIVDQELTKDVIELALIPLLSQNNIVVMQGFIGSASIGSYTTTLGKEGSDYTGALLAVNLQAKALRVWKDVPAIMTGDPKLFEDVKSLKELSYASMFTMAAYGAQVIHPNTIAPLAANHIPLYIQSLTYEDAPGTVVTADVEDEPSLPMYILRKDQVWVTLQPNDLQAFGAKLLHKVFISFNQLGMQINFLDIISSHIVLCCTEDFIHLKYLLDDLRLHFQLTHKRNASLLTILNGDKGSESFKILYNATILATKSFRDVAQTVFI